ncbi:unnamed protein product [Schistosoma margrebowiei]|uniref:Lengsin n=1 Tax=Schistosoma margrebowiei TaxID=48269 RepID=A0A183MGG0_9TREM|nr:unnamed protein product [Schistosoma margrebowiei]VDP17558.1 unnamed protein product [Schistosoma margrebowiei]
MDSNSNNKDETLKMDDVKERFIEEVEKFDYIRLSFPDLNGIHLSKLLSTRFARKIAKGESEVYSGAITGGPRGEVFDVPEIIKRKHVNSKLKPDFPTLHPCYWISNGKAQHSHNNNTDNDDNPRTRKYSICAVLCDLAWPNNEPMKTHPRVAVKKLIDELQTKYNLRLFSAFEPEFRAFQKGTFETTCLKPTKTGETNLRSFKLPVPYTKFGDIYRTSLLSVYEDFFIDIDHNMKLANIDIQDYSNEDGEGQLESPLVPSWGLSAADNYFILKQAIKEIGEKHNMEISFMTKPLLNASSSGCHYNHSLWYADTGRNAFYDNADPDGLSVTARHWIGGLIEHLPAMLAICSPTINCYRRLNKFFAPGAVNWDFRDRFVAIRVKNFDEKNTYIENRIPSSASCPYHVLAATLAAGMDGLDRQLEPPPPGQKPSESKNGNHVKLLPSSFQEALQNLKEDEIFTKKLGKDFFEWYTLVKELGDLGSLGHLDIKDNQEETLAFERYEYLKFT